MALSCNEGERAASTNLQALQLLWEKLLKACGFDQIYVSVLYQSEPEIYENPCEERNQTTNYCSGVCSMMPRHGDKVLKSSGLSQLSLLQREWTIQPEAHAPRRTFKKWNSGVGEMAQYWPGRGTEFGSRHPYPVPLTTCHSSSRGIQKPLASMGDTFTHPSSHIHT